VLYNIKKNLLILITLILYFVCSASMVQASIPEMSDSVNITYIGFNDSDSLVIEVLMEDYLGPEKNYLNRVKAILNHADSQVFKVNYHYIYSCETLYDNSELKSFSNPDTGAILYQDIVIIDMFWVYENQDLLDNLKAAKLANPNLKLIQIRSDEPDPDNIFYSQEDAELITLIEKKFIAYDFWNDSTQAARSDTLVTYKDDWSNPSNPFSRYESYEAFYESVIGSSVSDNEVEGASLAMAITCHLLKEYAPPEKIEEMCFEKTKILYVGFDPGTGSSNYSGTVTFDTLQSLLVNSVYGTYIEIDTVSFGTVPDSASNVYPQLQDTSWYSPQILYANMDEKNIQFEDYHIILLDGFFTKEIIDMFGDVFDDAVDAGADLLFLRQYLNTPTGTTYSTISASDLPAGAYSMTSTNFVMKGESAAFNQLIQGIKTTLKGSEMGTTFARYNFIYGPAYATLEYGGYLYHPLEKIREVQLKNI